jgi:hypothetical protein
MKKQLEKLTRLWEELIFTIGAPFRLFFFLRKLLREGCYTVSTVYADGKTQREFRTLIQFDADIIQYIPDVHAISKSKRSVRLMRTHYRRHQERLNLLIQLLERNLLAISVFFDTGIVAVNIRPLMELADQPTLEEAVVSGILLVSSLLFRKYLKPRLIQWLVKRAFQGVRLLSQKF